MSESPTALQTPSWLLRGEVGLCPCGCIGVRKKGSFVEKTLTGVSEVMGRAMFTDEVARQPGLLQRVDARVKVLLGTLLLVTAALVHHLPVLLGIYALTLVLAGASRLPIGFFVKRVWLFIPIFTGIIVLPATFSFITPGHVILPIWRWHGHPVGITAQGLASAGLMVMRVAASVSLVVLITLTTPWVKLLAGLRGVRVPRIFILIIGMAYRYIFLLLNSVTDMYTARKARTVGGRKDVKQDQRFVSASAGALFGKTQQLAEEVHMSMTSRGFRGDVRTLDPPRLALLDAVVAVAGIVLAFVALGGDRLLGR